MFIWIANLTFIGFFTAIIVFFLLTLRYKLFAQLVLTVALLFAIQTTISNLYPVVRDWQEKASATKSTLDKLGNAVNKLNGGMEAPIRGEITQLFHENHHGVDIAAVVGTKIYAQWDGVVNSIGWHDIYGNYVLVTYDNGLQALFAHLSDINVKDGFPLAKGHTMLGRTGNSGKSNGSHLHYEIRINGKAVDPLQYVKF